MIYLNTMQSSIAKKRILNSKPVPSNSIRANVGNGINFGQKSPMVVVEQGSLLKNFLNRFFNKNLIEKSIIDKFGKKSIEKYKDGQLCEKILFKKIKKTEFPNMLLKYEDNKLIEAQGLRQDGTAEFKRTYDKITGEQKEGIFYGPDGKTPAFFGV